MGIDLEGIRGSKLAEVPAPLPELTDREAVNRIVRVWAAESRLYLSEAWGQLYGSFSAAFNITLTKSSGGSYLDQIEDLGLMPSLRAHAERLTGWLPHKELKL